MRILMIGRLETWMAFHLQLMSKGFEQCGCTIRLVDYHKMNRLGGYAKLPETLETKLFSYQLKKIVKDFNPEVIFFVAALKEDPLAIKEYFKGKIIFYDYDGERYLKKLSSWLPHLDLLLTGESQILEFMKDFRTPAVCLPGAVDGSIFAPRSLSSSDKQIYGSPISYIGRATERRINFCNAIADLGLTVYGERWHRQIACQKGGPLANSWRFKRDVSDEEAIKIYNASGCVINILQQNAFTPSMQVYHIPCCGACLLTEYCNDLPDIFEIGSEILAFSSPEELRELAQHVLREPELARKIGENGRKRCLAQYTFKHRAERILKALE